MELSKRIEGTRHLGNEFLTWLMVQSIAKEGQLTIEEGPLELWFESKLTLVSPYAGSEMNILKGESPAQSQEARVAVRQGKQIEDAAISIKYNATRYDFQFNGPKFALSGVKLPTAQMDTEFEQVIDRFDRLGTLEQVMRSLYHEFLKLRLDEGAWQAECRNIEHWLASQ